MRLPERIKELREYKGIKQIELAKVLNVAPPRISEWEAGKKRPVYEDLIAMAAYFEVSVGYLLGVEDF